MISCTLNTSNDLLFLQFFKIGSNLGSNSGLKTMNDNCRGGPGFCVSGCGNTWKVWRNDNWVTDTTLKIRVTCRGKKI